MSERRLGGDLISRFTRVAWTTLVIYAVVVTAVFGVLSELSLGQSLSRTAGVIESLLGLYADPGGERSSVPPTMLVDQLIGMGAHFVITRTGMTEDGGRSVYFLTPDMPAQRIETMSSEASVDEMRAEVARAVTGGGRWTYRILHRRSGEFDVFVAESRTPQLVAIAGVGAAALLLLPLAAMTSRLVARRSVEAALVPVERMRTELQTIGPEDLSRRVSAPAGIAEITEIADTVNRMITRVERSHVALEAFTADASHELRTPLTHLRARVQWALDAQRSPEAMYETLSAMNAEIERTVRMVEDLLLIARGENQQVTVERKPFAVGAVAREVAEITEAMVSGRDVTVEVRSDGDVEAVGDVNCTRQILLNLASNAARYTQHGQIAFQVVTEPGRAGVAVEDTGEGIPADRLAYVFDRFYRVEPSRSRAHGGAGLGLTIARLYAELQDGSIAVWSEPGAGSRFTVWLPVAAEPTG
jgi:signal transduction histidine kinase